MDDSYLLINNLYILRVYLLSSYINLWTSVSTNWVCWRSLGWKGLKVRWGKQGLRTETKVQTIRKQNSSNESGIISADFCLHPQLVFCVYFNSESEHIISSFECWQSIVVDVQHLVFTQWSCLLFIRLKCERLTIVIITAEGVKSPSFLQMRMRLRLCWTIPANSTGSDC